MAERRPWDSPLWWAIVWRMFLTVVGIVIVGALLYAALLGPDPLYCYTCGP